MVEEEKRERHIYMFTYYLRINFKLETNSVNELDKRINDRSETKVEEILASVVCFFFFLTFQTFIEMKF